ncbi:BPL-N domain-containing protein [Fodinicola acaciae]|uniref:BPL-N domain-containing protein n=1 Tax=Fodinicola acaciae TaxID=2681555 RepID=UPI0013D15DB1|nr:BPL-N domain-containing protein [Fodinicola acaciae]
MRRWIALALTAALVAALAACGGQQQSGPLALVYRGPAACSGCADAVAKLLRNSPSHFRVMFVGPDGDQPLSAATLKTAVVYAQPGGGSLDPAWRRMRHYADDIRAWVRGGGTYLGFCLGGYLAGATPGFGLLPGDTNAYIDSRGATVASSDDTVVAVTWRGQRRHMYFQDGPIFQLRRGSTATVLATYPTGAAAAVATTYGRGRVGVVGPHPEADQSWYSDARLDNPDGVRPDLGYDLIETTVHLPAPAPTR